MFARMIDDFKQSTSTALRLTSLAAAVAVALFITLAFLCAAAFVYVLQTYGLIEACLTGAGIFLLVALIAGIGYMVRRNSTKARAAETAKSAVHTALADPMLVAAGISPESLLMRDPTRPGWKRGLDATTGVVCDSVTALELPAGVFPMRFTLLDEASIAPLRAMEAALSGLDH